MLDLFLDARGFAGEIAQVVQLRASHTAAALDRDLGDARSVDREGALHTLAVRYLAHRKRRVEAAIAARDDHAFIGLNALAIAFDPLDLHHDRIAGLERRYLAGHALGFECLDNVHRRLLKSRPRSRAAAAKIPPIRPCARHRAAPGRSTPAVAARGGPRSALLASAGPRRDRRRSAPPAPAGPGTRPAACNAASPANPRRTTLRRSSVHRPARPAAAAPAHRSTPAPAARHLTPHNRRSTVPGRPRARAPSRRCPRSAPRSAPFRAGSRAAPRAPASAAAPVATARYAHCPRAGAAVPPRSPRTMARASTPSRDRRRTAGHRPCGARPGCARADLPCQRSAGPALPPFRARRGAARPGSEPETA